MATIWPKPEPSDDPILKGTVELGGSTWFRQAFIDSGRWPQLYEQRCEHQTGRWCFVHNGLLYGFDPSSQLKKDPNYKPTLGELVNADRAVMTQWVREDEKNRVGLVKWLCFTCKTVQMLEDKW